MEGLYHTLSSDLVGLGHVAYTMRNNLQVWTVCACVCVHACVCEHLAAYKLEFTWYNYTGLYKVRRESRAYENTGHT